MVLDTLEKIDMYEGLHPSFSKVIAYLKDLDFNSLQRGKIVVDDDFYINVDEADLKDAQSASLEVHDAYIDIQIPITNSEFVGYKSREQCKVLKELRPGKDITFFKDEFSFSFSLPVGSFAIFFPQDAHAPLIGSGKTRKIIVKVKV